VNKKMDTYRSIKEKGGFINQLLEIYSVPNSKGKIKIVRLVRWMTPFMEELNEGLKVVSKNHNLDQDFKVDEYLKFVEGDEEKFSAFQQELDDLLDTKIINPSIRFKEKDFEGSNIPQRVLMFLVDYDLFDIDEIGGEDERSDI